MVGIDLATDAHGEGNRVIQRARNHGAIVRPLGNTIVLNPPLAISLEEVDALVSAVDAALD